MKMKMKINMNLKESGFAKTTRLLILTALITLFSTVGLSAQYGEAEEIKEGQSLDKIIAVVGNEVILKSDLDAQVQILAQQNPDMDINDKKTRDEILDAIINEKLVVTKAFEDSIVVSEEEVKQRWDFQLEKMKSYYGSLKRIEDAYRMSITRMQYEYSDIIKKRLLAEKIQQQKFSSISVSSREVKKFYEDNRDSLTNLPEMVEIYHIVKNVEAGKKAKEDTYNLAVSVRDSILKGADFAELAARYSGDPGTASEGGDLGWVGKGRLFREYEKAAFELLPGSYSKPVETPYGYHIIQTIEKTRDSVLTRHILFKLGDSNEDNKVAVSALKALIDSVKNGADFELLAKAYSDEKETKGFGGKLGKMPVENIPPNIKSIVDALADGDVSEPYPYNVNPTQKAFHIVRKKRTIPSHFPSLEEDFKELEQLAIKHKQMKLYQEWIEELRKELYWEIK